MVEITTYFNLPEPERNWKIIGKYVTTVLDIEKIGEITTKIQFTITGVQPHRNRKYFQFNNAHDCTMLQYNILNGVTDNSQSCLTLKRPLRCKSKTVSTVLEFNGQYGVTVEQKVRY